MALFSKLDSTLPPSTGWEELKEPGEDKLFEQYGHRIEAQQREVAKRKKDEPLRRGFHAKTHAGLIAEFQVLADLPAHARFGVFSEPRVFPALVRFSNGKPDRNPDKGHEPRGIAIKLVGVPGPKLLKAQRDAVTQDFLATSHSVTSTVRNVGQFMAFIDAGQKGVKMPFGLARAVGFGESVRILYGLVRTVLLSKVRSMVTEQFSSTAPIKVGPYAVKFTVRPADGTEKTTKTKRPLEDDFLLKELADRLRKRDVVLDFLLQFYVSNQYTPIEDTSVHWKSVHAPFLKVAQVRILSCDLDNDARARKVSKAVDRLAFTPWHATEDHRPLGNVMRARQIAYLASSDLRGHDPEPTSLTEDDRFAPPANGSSA